MLGRKPLADKYTSYKNAAGGRNFFLTTNYPAVPCNLVGYFIAVLQIGVNDQKKCSER